MMENETDSGSHFPAGPWYNVAAFFLDPPFEVACRLPGAGTAPELMVVDLLTGAFGMLDISGAWRDPGNLSEEIRRQAAEFVTLSAANILEYIREGEPEPGLLYEADRHRTLTKAAVKDAGPWYYLPVPPRFCPDGSHSHPPFELACQQPFRDTILVIEARSGNMGMYSLHDCRWVQSEDLSAAVIREAEDYVLSHSAALAAEARRREFLLIRVQNFGVPL